MLTKKLYEQATGRSQKSNVIAYQIRQSFRPGEITAEEANQVGYELASRFLKGKHAFIVAYNDASNACSSVGSRLDIKIYRRTTMRTRSSDRKSVVRERV